jgi:hypothetical protein
MPKNKKQCQNCKWWSATRDAYDNYFKGFCNSKKRKAQKTIPLSDNYITAYDLPGCDFWEAKNKNE